MEQSYADWMVAVVAACMKRCGMHPSRMLISVRCTIDEEQCEFISADLLHIILVPFLCVGNGISRSYVYFFCCTGCV